MCISDRSQIAHEILTYLVEYKDTQDTFEGIVEWWLLEQRVKRQAAKVKKALDDLVAKNLVIERKGRDARTHYRINRHRVEEIRALLRQESA